MSLLEEENPQVFGFNMLHQEISSSGRFANASAAWAFSNSILKRLCLAIILIPSLSNFKKISDAKDVKEIIAFEDKAKAQIKENEDRISRSYQASQFEKAGMCKGSDECDELAKKYFAKKAEKEKIENEIEQKKINESNARYSKIYEEENRKKQEKLKKQLEKELK